MSFNRDAYREFCSKKMNLPVFLYDWWLDAVCGEDKWDVAIVKPDTEILAFMPYFVKNILSFNISIMPQLTQFLGPWINYPNDLKETNRAEFEKKMMSELIEQLPESDNFEQNFHYSVNNWLPFYWKGYEQTTRYTYVIEDISYPERIFENFTPAKRKNIKKAEETVEIRFDMGAAEFYRHHTQSLQKQNIVISYPEETFKRIYESAYSHKAGRTIYAVDKQGNIHSALFVLWSKYSAYDLISSIDPEYKNSDSASLLVWEMIKYLSGKTYRFDFEGSMIESVERSFRQFGTVQKAYFNIRKNRSLTYRIFRYAREKFRKN